MALLPANPAGRALDTPSRMWGPGRCQVKLGAGSQYFWSVVGPPWQRGHERDLQHSWQGAEHLWPPGQEKGRPLGTPSHEGDTAIGQAKPGVGALISQVEHTTPTAAGLSWSVEAPGLPSGRQGHGDGQIKLGS